ncbi:MAG: sulfotransferase domain-containing protein [Clostridia bacterium]|nr:sulfotransferase domain-containing protein [Clostridia bacterium]MBN2883548.1 sulfotransferase domain-containing protein [Clostridia bacterium]
MVMLRDPVERAFSQYGMKCSKRNERRSFNRLIKEELANEKKLRSITGRGLYSEQLDRVFKLFKKENIQIIRFEDITTRTHETLENIFSFLNIDYEDIETEVEQNTTPDSRPRGIAGLYYKVPFGFRRKFYDISPVLTEFLRKKFIANKRAKVNEAVLDVESKEMLSEFYKESNEILRQKYGIDTSKWI